MIYDLPRGYEIFPFGSMANFVISLLSICYYIYLGSDFTSYSSFAIFRPSIYDKNQLEDIQAGGHIPTFEDEFHGFLKCRSEGGETILYCTCKFVKKEIFAEGGDP